MWCPKSSRCKMQWTCIRLFILVYSLQISWAAYLSNVAVELLAPPAGQEPYLWIGFRTTPRVAQVRTANLKSEDFPYHSLLQEESESSTQQILSFAANCSSLVELAGWPGSIACHGGFFQFDGVLSAATWYELVNLSLARKAFFLESFSSLCLGNLVSLRSL